MDVDVLVAPGVSAARRVAAVVALACASLPAQTWDLYARGRRVGTETTRRVAGEGCRIEVRLSEPRVALFTWRGTTVERERVYEIEGRDSASATLRCRGRLGEVRYDVRARAGEGGWVASEGGRGWRAATGDRPVVLGGSFGEVARAVSAGATRVALWDPRTKVVDELRVGRRPPVRASKGGETRSVARWRLVHPTFFLEVFCLGERPLLVRDARTGWQARARDLAGWRLDDAPDGVREEDVCFAGPAGAIAGTLSRPAVAPVRAAVLLLDGSGPDARDARVAGHAFMDRIAHRLALEGIATLRCDDRGTGGTAGTFEGIGLPDLVADAGAALAHLCRATGRDVAAIVGHSEGTIVGGLLAAADDRVSALFLLGAPATPLDAVLVEQDLDTRRTLSLRGTRPLTAWADPAVQARIRASADGTVSVAGEEHDVRWLRDHFRHDPLATLSSLRVPIEVFQGMLDAQVAPHHGRRIERVLGDAPEVAVHFLPGLDHVFMRPSPTGSLSAPDRGLSEAFLDLLVERVATLVLH